MLINPNSTGQLGNLGIEAIASMNQFLRGEIAATEAYEKALSELDGELNSIRLSAFLSDHHEATLYWRDQVLAEYADPENHSGTWGTFVRSVVNAAKILGVNATLKALREGEEYGLEEYEMALKKYNLSESHKYYIRNVLIPNQRRHIAELNAMLKTKGEAHANIN